MEEKFAPRTQTADDTLPKPSVALAHVVEICVACLMVSYIRVLQKRFIIFGCLFDETILNLVEKIFL